MCLSVCFTVNERRVRYVWYGEVCALISIMIIVNVCKNPAPAPCVRFFF